MPGILQWGNEETDCSSRRVRLMQEVVRGGWAQGGGEARSHAERSPAGLRFSCERELTTTAHPAQRAAPVLRARLQGAVEMEAVTEVS